MTNAIDEFEHADCIYVFKEGQIVARGTHQELLEHSVEYQKLAGQFE